MDQCFQWDEYIMSFCKCFSWCPPQFDIGDESVESTSYMSLYLPISSSFPFVGDFINVEIRHIKFKEDFIFKCHLFYGLCMVYASWSARDKAQFFLVKI